MEILPLFNNSTQPPKNWTKSGEEWSASPPPAPSSSMSPLYFSDRPPLQFQATPLYYAARNGHLAVVKWSLTKEGVDINSTSVVRSMVHAREEVCFVPFDWLIDWLMFPAITHIISSCILCLFLHLLQIDAWNTSDHCSFPWELRCGSLPDHEGSRCEPINQCASLSLLSLFSFFPFFRLLFTSHLI